MYDDIAQAQATTDEPLDPALHAQKQALLAKLLKGAARGTAAFPFDMADVAGQALGQRPGAGKFVREKFLGGEGGGAEQVGELFSPTPPIGKAAKVAGMGVGMLVDAARATKHGFLHPDALGDALRMKNQGVPDEAIWAKTRVEVSSPSVLKPDPVAVTAIETPGYTQGPGPKGPFDMTALSNRIAFGDVRGLDNFMQMYPEFGSMRVLKTDAQPPKVLGSYSERNNQMMLNYAMQKSDPAAWAQHGGDKTLGHELVHAAQQRDKAPPGGNQGLGDDIVNRIGGMLDTGGRNLETALLARTLLERTGRSGRASYGHQAVADLQRVIESNPKAFKGSAPLNNRGAALALTRNPDELEEAINLNAMMQGKLPANAWDAYLKSWGEVKARQSEQYLGKPKSFLEQNSPQSLKYESPIKPDDMIDVRDFDPRLLRKLGLI